MLVFGVSAGTIAAALLAGPARPALAHDRGRGPDPLSAAGAARPGRAARPVRAGFQHPDRGRGDLRSPGPADRADHRPVGLRRGGGAGRPELAPGRPGARRHPGAAIHGRPGAARPEPGRPARRRRPGRLAPRLGVRVAARLELGRGGAGADGASGSGVPDPAVPAADAGARRNVGRPVPARRLGPGARRTARRARRGRLGPVGRLVLGAGPAAQPRQPGPARAGGAVAHGHQGGRRRRPLADR